MNAYVTGMKEAVGFSGNQLTQVTTVFFSGYILGMIPSNMALQYVRPHIFFPSILLFSGFLTMITAAIRNIGSLMVIRFFLGLAESSMFVGSHYILGSW